jgi:hypothetical protein
LWEPTGSRLQDGWDLLAAFWETSKSSHWEGKQKPWNRPRERTRKRLSPWSARSLQAGRKLLLLGACERKNPAMLDVNSVSFPMVLVRHTDSGWGELMTIISCRISNGTLPRGHNLGGREISLRPHP